MNSYNGLLYIFDREEKLLSILNNEASESDIFFDDEFKKELNGEWSYKFSVDMSKTKDLMLEYNKVGFYDRRGNFQLFVIHDIEDNIGYEAIRTVYCLHDFQSLNEDIIEDGKVTGNARNALELALRDSAYSVGIVSDTDQQVKNLSMITKLEAICSIAETYGLEIYYRLELDETKTKIVKRYVDLVEMLGEDTGLSFDFSLNIESIKRKINNNFFTVLYGRGKELQDGNYANFADAEWTKPNNPTNKPKGRIWVADEEAIAKYGVRKGIYSNENISRADTLLTRTWEKLKTVNRPKINYEASVYELSSITGYENLKINLGDRFKIIDDIYNINEDVRVIAEYESILDETSKKVELGDPLSCLTDDVDSDDSYLDSDESEDSGEGGEGEGEEAEGEDTLPDIPVVTVEGYFATVSISWTFENKSYYTYELYASDVRGFEPTEDNKIFEGKASAFLHEVEPMETWYYKVRVKNGYGRYTDFSEEVSAETLKIADGSKYFESASIKDALIGDLRLDRGWVGKLTGTYIDAKNLSVTDGNGKRTLDIDSYGNVCIDAKDIKMNGNAIDLTGVVTFKDLSTSGQTVINGDNITSGTIKGTLLQTYADDNTKGVRISKESMQLNNASLFYETNGGFNIQCKEQMAIGSMNDIYIMPGLNASGASTGNGSVVIPSATLRPQNLYVVNDTSVGGNLACNGSVSGSSLSTSGNISATSGDVSAGNLYAQGSQIQLSYGYGTVGGFGYLGHYYLTLNGHKLAKPASGSGMYAFCVTNSSGQTGYINAHLSTNTYSSDVVKVVNEEGYLKQSELYEVCETPNGKILIPKIMESSIKPDNVEDVLKNNMCAIDEDGVIHNNINNIVYSLWNMNMELKKEIEDLKSGIG